MHLRKALTTTRSSLINGAPGMRLPPSASGRIALTSAYARHMRTLVTSAVSKVGASFLIKSPRLDAHSGLEKAMFAADRSSASSGDDVVVNVTASSRVASVTSAAVYVSMTQEASKELEAAGGWLYCFYCTAKTVLLALDCLCTFTELWVGGLVAAGVCAVWLHAKTKCLFPGNMHPCYSFLHALRASPNSFCLHPLNRRGPPAPAPCVA